MLNVAAINGRLTADPELRHTQSDTPVTSFTVAVDRSYCKQGEDRQCDFIDCVAWRGTAEFVCKHFKKGQMIAVSGELQTRNWTDKNDNKRKSTEIIASGVNFCGSKADNQGSSGGSYQPASGPAPDVSADDSKPADSSGSKSDDFQEVPPDDDLPF